MGSVQSAPFELLGLYLQVHNLGGFLGIIVDIPGRFLGLFFTNEHPRGFLGLDLLVDIPQGLL